MNGWRLIDRRIAVIVAVLAAGVLSPAARVAAQDPVRLYGAGSLRPPLTAIAERFTAQLVLFILSPDGQQILARHGFVAPTRLGP